MPVMPRILTLHPRRVLPVPVVESSVRFSHSLLLMTLALAGAPSVGLTNENSKLLSVEFRAKGVVCALCVQSLKKHFLTEPGVRSVDIDLKARRVTVGVDQARAPTQERLRVLVEESGFGYDDSVEPSGK